MTDLKARELVASWCIYSARAIPGRSGSVNLELSPGALDLCSCWPRALLLSYSRAL